MSFFKAYDMRGTFGVDFDLQTVYRVGRALPKVVTGNRWLVGRDCRTTSAAVRDALLAGLRDAGAHVTDLGLCTTPMVYFFTAEDGYDGSVMITASHNPPSDNGLKVSSRGAVPVGYANGLNEVERLVLADTATYTPTTSLPPEGAPSCDDANQPDVQHLSQSFLSRYLSWMKSKTSSLIPHPSSLGLIPHPSSLTYAIDCSNGMASLLAHQLFPSAEIINDTLDGTFPAHSPNPLKADAREQIAALVRKHKLDFGIIFDGDADRCMFVDERGDFAQPDYLIPFVAKATMRRVEGSGKIIHDVRTSRGAIDEIVRMGCEPVMVPVGHAFAKPVLRESGAVCGGELAGHYYFREFAFCDSGILAALRIMEEIANAKAKDLTFSEMMDPVMGVYANSGELNFKVEDKDAAIERVLKVAAAKLPPEVSRATMDGLRLEYREGWVSIRKSNTEPYLRLLIECDTSARLAVWVDTLTQAIQHSF